MHERVSFPGVDYLRTPVSCCRFNFGTSTGTVNIWEGTTALPCTPITQWKDASIICTLPAGVGAKLPMIVTTLASSQTSTFNFSYAAPVIFSVSPPNYPTVGGATIVLSGNSFGKAC